MKNIKKLPRREEKIMMVIWENRPPVPRNILSKALESEGWTAPTILTMLSRLVKKGYLTFEKQGNKNMYTPLVSKQDYMVTESITFGEKVKDMSITSLMTAFVESRGITDEEISELEKMIQAYKTGNRD